MLSERIYKLRRKSGFSQEQLAEKVSKTLEVKVGIGLCLMGAICLMLSGIMMIMSPTAAEQLNEASTITLSGSGILLILCVLFVIVGLVLILRKR